MQAHKMRESTGALCRSLFAADRRDMLKMVI